MAKITIKTSAAGQICIIDSLGRIVIPSPLRKAYGLEKNEAVELMALEDGILMRKYQPGCVFCGNIMGLSMFKEQRVCDDCIKEILQKGEQQE
ncbi:MAG: AbrB/MazE/SpoVT family DNA-binding domain-containing protein [Acutalibacteraceae bacterium]